MSVIISAGLVVNGGGNDLNANSPIIGYQNLVTTANVSATSEEPDYPASNLGNPATHLLWRSAAGSPSSPEYITVILDTNELVDYVGIARHNFYSNLTPVTLEGAITPDVWFELISERQLPDDGPAIFRFEPQSLYAVRLKIGEAAAAAPVPPQLAVMYAGALLVIQRRIYVGHTPITYGRKLQVVNNRSISGAFLGRIITSETRESNISLKNLTPAWYRSYFDPFLIAAKEIPFFWAWRPGDYPDEAGYVWLKNDPVPQNQLPNGMMQVDCEIEGIS